MRKFMRTERSASQARTETFTGAVWGSAYAEHTTLDELTGEDAVGDGDGDGDGGEGEGVMTVNDVTLAPAARTHWHRHEGGQLLVGLVGRGLYGVRNGAGGALRPGDVVWTPGGVEHWHGADADALVTHLAVSHGAVTWLDPVSVTAYEQVAERVHGAGGHNA